MIFWIREDRMGLMGKNRRNHGLTRATGNFAILSFSHVFKRSRLKKVICFTCARGPQRPVDVATYHVLHRQRSHVFLALCFVQREDRGGTPFIRRVCSAQAGEQGARQQMKFRAVVSFKPYVLRGEWTARGLPGSIWS